MFFVFYPLTSKLGWVETIQQYPQIHYSMILVGNTIIAFICFFAARWLRTINKRPSTLLYVSFNLIFILFPLGILLLWEDIAATMPISGINMAIIGFIFLLIPVFVFYLYTRMTTSDKAVAIKEQPGSLPENIQLIQQLSKREKEVIEALLAGNVSYKELSTALNISVNTVKTHLKNIYSVTGAANIAALLSLFTHKSPQNHL